MSTLTDFAPVRDRAREWAHDHTDHTVAGRFAAWFCGYYVEEILAEDPSLTFDGAWEQFRGLFSDLATVADFAPVHKHAFEFAYREVDFADNETADMFAAWFCGYYVEEILADDPSLTYRVCWERFLECFADVAEEWGR